MSIRRVFACVCGAVCLVLAGSATAQRSLFDQPAPGEASPPAAAPAGAATPPRAKPKPRKPRGPVPARSLTVQNASANTLTALEVSGDGKSARLANPIKAGGKASLKLPAMKRCVVAVSASFEGAGQAEASEFDICNDKTIRFTE